MENVPAMSGINERAAARIMKDVLGEASCKTDVLANIVPQLRNGNGVEVKNKNCGPPEIDGCNASVIETTYAPYPGLRGVLNNEESANNIVSEDCVDGVVQEDTKNKNYIMLHYIMQYIILHIMSKDFIYLVSDDFIVSEDDFIYIMSEDYIMQEDIKNVPLINEKSAALQHYMELRKNKNKEPEPEPDRAESENVRVVAKTGGCTARCTASAEPPGHYH